MKTDETDKIDKMMRVCACFLRLSCLRSIVIVFFTGAEFCDVSGAPANRINEFGGKLNALLRATPQPPP